MAVDSDDAAIRRTLATYAAVIESMDETVGLVMKTLDDLIDQRLVCFLDR